MTTKRCASILLLLAAAALLLAGCGGSDSKDDGGSTGSKRASGSSGDSDLDAEVAKRADSYDAAPAEKLDPKQKYVVDLDTDEGTIRVDVDPKAAPIAAANFVFLVKEGYYDGVKFHRVMKDFMIQTGDPTGTGMGGPGYELKDDPVTGTYDKGVVAMANRGPNTGGSQFFIVHAERAQLPPDYVIFGKVADDASLETVDAIASVEVEAKNGSEVSSPVEPVRIRSAKLVEPKG